MQLCVFRVETPFEFVGLLKKTNAVIRCRTVKRLSFKKIRPLIDIEFADVRWDLKSHKLVCKNPEIDIFVS